MLLDVAPSTITPDVFHFLIFIILFNKKRKKELTPSWNLNPFSETLTLYYQTLISWKHLHLLKKKSQHVCFSLAFSNSPFLTSDFRKTFGMNSQVSQERVERGEEMRELREEMRVERELREEELREERR